MDYGEQLVDDDLTDSHEKQKIQEDVIDIERTLKGLKEDALKEKIRYGAYLGYMHVYSTCIIARVSTFGRKQRNHSTFVMNLLCRLLCNLREVK